MANVHYSYRGQPVDMDASAKKFEKEIALGNARMNAKGDIVGKGGKIIKTREQQLAEYKEANAPIKIGKVNISNEEIDLNDVAEAKPVLKRPEVEGGKRKKKVQEVSDFIPDEKEAE